MRLLRITGWSLVAVAVFAFGACSDGAAQGEPGDEVSKAQYDTWMTELSNWGRWGDEDQLGALNLCHPIRAGSKRKHHHSHQRPTSYA
jgi:hypothetical protein